MEKEPLVSVVMPAYNAGATIGETIDSLLQQTFTDWELIVVNDGSTDKTSEVVKGYLDPRIRLISLERNMGNATASNTALRESRGKYIVIMDADDISFPERVGAQVAFLEAHPDVDGCGSGHVIMTRCVLYDRVKAFFEKNRSRFVPVEEVTCSTLFGGSVYNPTMCFKRSILDLLSVWRDPDFRSGSDDIFYNRVIAAGARLVILPDVFLRYRRLQSSNSRRFKQSAWDNKARTALEAVHRLVPQASAEQDELHSLVVHRDFSLTPDKVDQIRDWFNILVEANREKRLFDEPALLRTLAHHWGRVCAIVGCHNFMAGWNAWHSFALLNSYRGATLAFLYEWQKRAFGKKRTRPKQ